MGSQHLEEFFNEGCDVERSCQFGDLWPTMRLNRTRG